MINGRIMTRHLAVAAALLALAGCGGTTGGLDTPVHIACAGKFQIAIMGSASGFSGVNGSITGDCGQGATFDRTNGTTPAAAAPLAGGMTGP